MLDKVVEFLENSFVTGWIAPYITGIISAIAVIIFNKFRIKIKVKRNKFVDMYNENYNVLYNYGVHTNAIFCEKSRENKRIIINVVFDKKTMEPLNDVGWAGYAIKKLPIRDFKFYIKNRYYIKFNAIMYGNIKFMTVEIKTAKSELIKKRFSLCEENQDYFICLFDFIDTIDDWEDVQEICFVFFPKKTIEQKGKIIISNLRIEK